MIIDIDDILLPFLKWTIVFWLIPYILWFFFQSTWKAAWHWVTEPEREIA